MKNNKITALTLISVLFSAISLMAQGKALGKVTAVSEDKRHSVIGTLIRYTDAYGKTYLELGKRSKLRCISV